MPYILEVQRFDPNGHITNPQWNGKCAHVGYMNKVFKTKRAAGDYYNTHNPHLRSLNAHNTWKSDWDPESRLVYIVREYYGEYLTIPPFEVGEPAAANYGRSGQ